MAESIHSLLQTMEWFFWLMLLILSSILTDTILKKVRSRRLQKLPPGPPGLPIIGSLFQLGKRPHETFTKLAAKYGPLISLRLGSRIIVVASSPAVAEEILTKQDEVFCGRTVSHAMEIHAPYSFAFAQPDPHWRFLRKISAINLFTTKKVESFQSLRKAQISETLRQVLESASVGKAVDIGHITFGCNVNALATIIFGEDLVEPGSIELERLLEAIHEAVELMGPFKVADYIPALRALDPQGLKRRGDKVFKRIYHIFEELIQKRLREKPARTHNDFLQVLLEQKSDEFGFLQIKGYLADMLFGATDTVTALVQWAMAELMQKPQLISKLQEEMDVVIGKNRLIEENDAQKLPYLSAVIKEVLRLHPVTPFLVPRRAIRETELRGCRIPKDAHILVNIWGMGREPTLWKNAEKFDPQRFMDVEIDYKGRHFELLPFGSGRRICVGISHGSKMLFLVLGSLLHSFDWNVPRGIDMSEKFGLVAEKAVPLLLVPKPRLPNHVYYS